MQPLGENLGTVTPQCSETAVSSPATAHFFYPLAENLQSSAAIIKAFGATGQGGAAGGYQTI